MSPYPLDLRYLIRFTVGLSRTSVIATSASARNGIVVFGGATRGILLGGRDKVSTIFSATLGQGGAQPLLRELEAVVRALRTIVSAALRTITVWTRNRSALSAVTHPGRQSGQ